METNHEKSETFFFFPVTEEMYESIKGLSWVRTAAGRDKPLESDESLETSDGYHYKIAYRRTDGSFVVRGAFRFLCEGLAVLKQVSEAGGLTTELRQE